MSHEDEPKSGPTEPAETPDTTPETDPAPENAVTDHTEDSLKDVNKEMKEKFEKAHTAAEKVAANSWLKEKVVGTLTSRALAFRKRAHEKPNSYPGRLTGLWNALSDEGKAEFASGNMFLKEMGTNLIPGAVLFKVPLKMYKLFKVYTFPSSWLSLSDFDPKEVKSLISMGALDAPEELTKKVDAEASDFLKIADMVAWAAKFIPEIGPEIAVMLKAGIKVASVPSEWMKEVLPEVRTRVNEQLEKEAEAPEAVTEGVREEVAYDAQPQVTIDHPHKLETAVLRPANEDGSWADQAPKRNAA